MKEKKYQASYGLLRIIACFSVVFHHFISANQQYINTLESQGMYTAVDNLLMCNNCLFFMLSGKFALEHYKGGIGRFYKDKALKIVLPFFLFSVYYYLADGGLASGTCSLWGFVKAFMGCEILGYLWFVYSLIGFYLVVPFLAPMMKAMGLKEKRWLTILLIMALLPRNLCQIMGWPFVLNGFPFYYLTFMLLGYLLDNIGLDKKIEYLMYGLSIPAAIVSCYIAVYKPGWNPDIQDYCLSRVLMCIGIFLFITRRTVRLSDLMHKPIKWVADQTYYLYLIHILTQGFFFTYLWNVWVLLVKLPFLFALFLGSIIIFVLSLPMAFVCKKCLDYIVLGLGKIGSIGNTDGNE